MEIKINREIRDYHESMFMGLSLRQSIFSVLAIASAVGLYFWLQPVLGAEITSWVCVLGAAPFAVLGFVFYHGMPAEKFFWVWFRSEVLEPKQLCCKPNNLYYELMKDTIAKHEKEVKNTHESDQTSAAAG